MRSFRTSLTSYFQTIAANRQLVGRLLEREFTARFKGNTFGAAWMVVTPLLTAAAFTFVFTVVFPARWDATSQGSQANFALLLLTGMAVHGMFAETVARAPTLLTANANYVTRVVFPLEILPLVAVLNAAITASVAVLIVILGNLLLHGQLNWTLLLLPVVLAPYIVVLLAICFLLSAVGVFFRDLTQIVALLVTLSLFLTPIFYPISAVPPAFQVAMYMNPLTFPVEQARQLILAGRTPNWTVLAIYLACALAALAGAHWLFQRLRKGFADVL